MKALIVCLIILVALAALAWKSSRFGYETAAYSVIEKQGQFEVRQYDDLVIASTRMDSPDPNDGGTFMRLFRYISKDNVAEEKIAMTTPVFMSGDDNAEMMSFVVPKSIADKGAPEPKSEAVEVSSWNPGKVAVYRYSGSWDSVDKSEALGKLRQWMKEQNLTAKGEEFNAGYDPPFTPKFLRRNEVLIPIN